MKIARLTPGNRRLALWHRIAVTLTLGCLTMTLGCAGLTAVRPAVVSQISSQPLQELDSATETPAPDSQQPQPQTQSQAVSQQAARSLQPGPWASSNQTDQSGAESPDSHLTARQPEYQAVPPVAPQVHQPVALVGYQEQQAVQPALQLNQPMTLGESETPSSQPAEYHSGQPASLGVPRQMLDSHRRQPTGSSASMPQQPVHAIGHSLPAPPVPNDRQFPTQVASHMGNVINIQGARFRPSPKTATEIMIAYKAENDRLKQAIKLGKQARMNLKEQLSFQQQLNKKTESQLSKSRDQASRLRAMVAKLQVRVERLVVEKDEIKQQSEAALRNIETNLDSVLMNSISRARPKPDSMN